MKTTGNIVSRTTWENSVRRYVLVIGAAVVALAIAVVVAFAVVSDAWLSDYAEQEQEWKGGATPSWVSDQVGIRIPEEAFDRRAGYRTSSRYDTAILAFTLPSGETDAYLSRLIPEGTKMIRNLNPEAAGSEPMAPFAHLGLTEPETVTDGMRKSDFCPNGLSSPEGKYLNHCVNIFVHEFSSGRTRIFVRSTIEPGVTPPPSTKEK